jgi:hypothetical protein
MLSSQVMAVARVLGLSTECGMKSQYLVTVRNKLVHDHDFNELPDRVHVAKSYDSVATELLDKLRGSSSNFWEPPTCELVLGPTVQEVWTSEHIRMCT